MELRNALAVDVSVFTAVKKYIPCVTKQKLESTRRSRWNKDAVKTETVTWILST